MKMRRRHTLTLFLLVSLAPLVGRAQGAPETHALPVGFYKPKAELLMLNPEDIRITGVNARVRTITPEVSQRRILILLDLSGSMRGWWSDESSKPWELAHRIIEEFVALLHPGDMVALHTFADTREELCSFARETRCVVERLRALPVPGSEDAKKLYGFGTRLTDALNAILELPDGEMQWGDVVLLISDGDEDHASVAKWNKVRADYVRRGIRVFHFRVALGLSANTAHLQGDRMRSSRETGVHPLIEDTGGYALDPWGAVRLPSTLVQMTLNPPPIKNACVLMHRMIREFYRAEIELSAPLQKDRRIKVEVWDAEKKKKRPGLLLYPRRIFPLAPPPRSP